MKVSDILRVKGGTLYTVQPQESLESAIETMSRLDIGSLAVIEHGDLVGMLTFREVLRILAKRQTERRVGPTPPIAEILVGEAMQTDPPTTSPDMDVDELRRLMVTTHTRYLPVMDGDTLMCVISFHDVAKAVLEERNFENKLLKAYIKDWPEEAK